MTKLRVSVLVVSSLVAFAVPGCADDARSTGLEPMGLPQAAMPGKSDGFCPAVLASLTTQIPAPHQCGPLDATSQALIADVNRFWGSQVEFCACGPDYPFDCQAATAHAGGWVYVNPDFVSGIRESGSAMPEAYIFAHEFGHEIQALLNIVPSVTQAKELQADCLAGYYLGSQTCRGIASSQDVRTTLATACVIADGTGDPVQDLETHGTCDQRANAVALGMEGYLSGADALTACAI